MKVKEGKESRNGRSNLQMQNPADATVTVITHINSTAKEQRQNCASLDTRIDILCIGFGNVPRPKPILSQICSITYKKSYLQRPEVACDAVGYTISFVVFKLTDCLGHLRSYKLVCVYSEKCSK